MSEIHGTKGPDLIPVKKGHVMATYKVRAREGRTVKMSGAIQDLDEITQAMQQKKATDKLLEACKSAREYLGDTPDQRRTEPFYETLRKIQSQLDDAIAAATN